MQAVTADSFATPTLLSGMHNLQSLLPVTFEARRDVTLNTHLNIFPNEAFSEFPKLRYFGLGIKGCYNADDTILSSAYNPRRVNMNLHQLIPLRCVPVDEDLSDSERALYRMRQRKVVGGEECFLYFLKLLEIEDQVRFKRINPTNGKAEPYELNPEYLQPSPVKPTADTLIDATDQSIVAYVNASLEATGAEVLEYITRAFDGDTRYARISEIGFFTGVDKVVNSTTGQGVAMSYTESIYTMLYEHITWTGTPLTRIASRISEQIEVRDGSVSIATA